MFYCEFEGSPAVEKNKPARESSETDLEIEGESGHSGVTGKLNFFLKLQRSGFPNWPWLCLAGRHVVLQREGDRNTCA